MSTILKPYRIGISAPFLNSTPTGIGTYTIETASLLNELSSQVKVFAPFVSKGIAESDTIITPTFIEGSVRFVNNLARFAYTNTVLPLSIRRHKIDCLFCPIAEFPFISSIPMVVTVHDTHPLLFPEDFGLSAYHFRLMLRMMPRFVSRVITPSEYVKEQLLKVMPIDEKRIDPAPLGFDASLFKPQDISRKGQLMERYCIKNPYVLFVSSLFKYKNVNVLIKSFLQIADRIPHCLVIIGRRDVYKGELISHKRIHYLDYVSFSDLPCFYSFADLFVHPSLSEGFGLTVLEAMACGAPVIASNRGALPEVVGYGGLLFDPYDVDLLATQMLDVIQHKRLSEELKQSGTKRASEFNWTRTAQTILNSCNKAMEQVH